MPALSAARFVGTRRRGSYGNNYCRATSCRGRTTPKWRRSIVATSVAPSPSMRSDAENWHFIKGGEISVLGDNGYTVPQCGCGDPGVVTAEASAAGPLG